MDDFNTNESLPRHIVDNNHKQTDENLRIHHTSIKPSDGPVFTPPDTPFFLRNPLAPPPPLSYRWYHRKPLIKFYTSEATPPRFKFNRRFLLLLILIDAIICLLLIRFLSYIELDWNIYMHQVQDFIDGERNYYYIRGIACPAGFIYVFALLKSITGGQPELAQIAFMVIYLIQLIIVLCIYQWTTKRDPITFSLVILSKGLHSIYILRCFNGSIAMTFTFASILAAQGEHWVVCCLIYSLALSIKINVLLFAPGLFWLLWELASRHDVYKTFGYLSLCGIIQIILGLPFLIHNPQAYIHRAFALTDISDYKTTLNWRFLPKSVFISKPWGVALLLAHVVTLVALWKRLWVRNKALQMSVEITRTYITFVFFSCNFVGVIFSRSLEHQFYSWYFPTIPFLLCHFPIRRPVKIILMACLEYCWNVTSSTSTNSLFLLVIHTIMLIGIFSSPIKDQWRREFLMTSPVNERRD